MTLVLQVSLALRDLLALPAPLERMVKVHLDPKGLLDLLEPLAAPSLANLELLVDLANLAAMDFLVRREILEPLDQWDQEDPPDLLAALGLLVCLLLASQDPQVFLEQWDLEESLV